MFRNSIRAQDCTCDGVCNAEQQPKQVNDPAMVAAARELRDRWLAQVNTTPLMGCGKYEVSRLIDQSVTVEAEPAKLLIAA